MKRSFTTYPVLPRNNACLVCRKRKVKCHGDRPECNECLVSGRKCQYEDITYLTRTQQLYERIRELQSKIQAAEQRISGHASSSSMPGGSLREGSPPGESSTTSYYAPTSTDPSADPSPLSGHENHIFVQLRLTFPALDSKGLSSWLAGPEPSPSSSEKLLGVFISRQSQFGFELHADRVMAGLKPDAPEPIIPALLNSMLLMACLFVGDYSLKAWENVFLERTKQAIEDNIERAYRCQDGYSPIHHLQAMLTLGGYYYIKGRVLEGHVQCSSTTRFAVTLGLHKINSRIFRPDDAAEPGQQASSSGLWGPRDSIELGEAINLWWTCCIFEYAGSTMNGLPPSIHRNEITTVWPRLLEDFEDRKKHLLPNDNYSTAALLDPQIIPNIADVSQDNVKSLLAKCCILMEYAGKLDVERIANPQNSEDWWTRFEECDSAVMQYTRTMPPVQFARNPEELAYLVLVHTVAYCSNVQLHSGLADLEIAAGAQGDPRGIQPDGSLGGLSYERCSEACRATALAATIVEDIDMTYMHVFMGLAWVCVAVVLIKEVPRLRESGRPEQALEKEQQLAVIERCMERLVATYPVLTLQVEQLQGLKNL
ncbi:hypothetical protein FRC08_014583 [Ceratobasidium sp. 394]|nr:hypothetical protein FRC08_014583 [Ceratobasidium sp. 394]